jgi:multidrug resistance efflux pump
MQEISAQEFGNLQGQVASLTTLVQELRAEVKDIAATLNSAKGGWRATMIVAGISGTLGAAAMKFLPLLSSLTPK